MEATKEYQSGVQTGCCMPSAESMKYVQTESDQVFVSMGNLNDDIFDIAREVGSNGFVYGINPAEASIKAAFDNAEKLGITNVDFIKSGYEKIKLNDGIAHRVTADCSVSNVEKKHDLWSEIYRILKKGGHFVVRDIYKPNGTPSKFAGDPGCSATVLSRAEYLELLYNMGFSMIRIVDEHKRVKNGTELISFTVVGEKPGEKFVSACRI